MTGRGVSFILFTAILFFTPTASAQQAGSIRGNVYDKDFDIPLPNAQIYIEETGDKITATDEGNFIFKQVPAGTYTLIFSKDGYTRYVQSNVQVSAGELTDVNASLPGEFTEMEEFIAQDLQIASTEAGLLLLRVKSPALMDSISSELLSQAGASDAASALNLVAGTTVSEGKYAVVRGLPDRYVNSQMNGVRLPTADVDKRAVELDQFPATVIKSIQITKTFTPDQQGDASGGAVNVVLKGIPDESKILKFKTGVKVNSQVAGSNEFLTSGGGGVNTWGFDKTREVQGVNIGRRWAGEVGTTYDSAPAFDPNMSLDVGGNREINDFFFDNKLKIGGFANFFYKRDSFLDRSGFNDSYWVETPGNQLSPLRTQIAGPEEFFTSLKDIKQSKQSLLWGGLGTFGLETENNSVNLAYLYTHNAEDKTILAEDTRGKQYFLPGYDPDDPTSNSFIEGISLAPWYRLETLQYTERTTQTLQFHGEHKLTIGEHGIENLFQSLDPEIDWTIARSSAGMDQPDKRQFGETWLPSIGGGLASHTAYKPAANFTLGNLQRIFKAIDEDSRQYSANIKFPFQQWSETEGYVKLGVFRDRVHRLYTQSSFSNFSDPSTGFNGNWGEHWSEHWGNEEHPITASNEDVNYEGNQIISAKYYMMDLPLTSWFKIICGARIEHTKLSIINDPEEDATWLPKRAPAQTELHPGDADVGIKQKHVLPSFSFEFNPIKHVSLRGSYNETIARQTFKELTPILQYEYLGGPIFVGDPELKISYVKNYDVRLDYTPHEGALLSTSYFYKFIKDPIEYEQRYASGFSYTTPDNFPYGRLSGVEVELRQDIGHYFSKFKGLSLGTNATFIRSQVDLPIEDILAFQNPAINVGLRKRPMLNTPKHLYNFYTTYNLESAGLQLGLFYTIKGDTLVDGAGVLDSSRFVPDIYALEYATLNFSLSKKMGKHLKLGFQAKNLTNPEIQEAYRYDRFDRDTLKSSYRKGIDYSVSLTGEW